jgi:hypothetical protein
VAGFQASRNWNTRHPGKTAEVHEAIQVFSRNHDKLFFVISADFGFFVFQLLPGSNRATILPSCPKDLDARA